MSGSASRRLRRSLAGVVSLVAAARGMLIRGQVPPAPQAAASGRGTPSAPPNEASRGSGHETEDMSGRLMMWLTVALGGSVVAVIGLMLLLLGSLREQRREQRPPLTAEQTMPLQPPKPNLQAHPVHDLAVLRANEDRLLHGYAWIDAGHARARIPIDRARTLMVGRSLEAAP